EFGHEAIQGVLTLIERMREAVGQPKWAFEAPKRPAGMDARVRDVGFQGVKDACSNIHKLSRYEQMGRAKKETVAALAAEFPNAEADLKEAFENLKYETMRAQVLKEKTRVDGRDFRTVRPINIEVGLLPRVHGST